MQIPSQDLFAIFWPSAHVTTVAEVAQIIRDNPGNETIRRGAALYGMLRVAYDLAQPASYLEDALVLLTKISQAKVEFDAAAWQSNDLVTATGALLLSAQRFVDTMTVPCDEWPTTKEVAEHIYFEAAGLAQAR